VDRQKEGDEMTERRLVNVIGGGLAGSEAAFYLLQQGYEVNLYERRPLVEDGAHLTDKMGELVCSNSLKSERLDNACGLLKEEMRKMGSLTMAAAQEASVPGGNALTVDRDVFADVITKKLQSFPGFHLIREEVKSLPEGDTVMATGPLTSGPLLDALAEAVGKKNLAFYDASAPIVRKDSLDFAKVYRKSRFEQGDDAYLNCPFTREEYETFVKELIGAQKALLHDFDTHYFEGCLPLEVMAARGIETLRHGPLKPFGLETPEHPKPYAVAQLRQDTKLGDYYNLVGFQTNLTYGEQKRVFSLIPGLEHAEFLRYGLMHRNSYIDAPGSLNPDLSMKSHPNIYIAGQLSGVEGYVESAALGIVAGINLDRKLRGQSFLTVPTTTVLGALIDYVIHSTGAYFQPMNANWALLPSSSAATRQETIVKSLDAIESYWNASHE
jgi:methylenetetrahydrofolate--tRNA-(uracil-5-)-methyltransferase